MTSEQLTLVLVEKIMGWSIGPDRFMLPNRRWMPRWRFQPADKLDDAFRLLQQAAPEQYTIRGDEKGSIDVEVHINGTAGEARGTSISGAVTYAIARAIGVEV